MPSFGNQGIGAKPAKPGIGDLERMLLEAHTAEDVALKVAQILRVRRGEIALMRLEKNSLRFLYPVELRLAGMLPLSGSAVAARTASTRTPMMSNSFLRVKHVSLFEAVKLVEEENSFMEQMPIQKIMSVPITAPNGKVLGVVQVSRKGPDASMAGPDFTGDDMKLLEKAAELLSRAPFMQEGAPV